MDEEGNQQSIILWTTLVMKEQNEYSYKQFIELFLHPSLSLLTNITEPRINEEIRKVLKRLGQARTRDWYLYQNYIELRIYGYELPPYKLPKFLPMRIFALEYIKQMLNVDEVHVV